MVAGAVRFCAARREAGCGEDASEELAGVGMGFAIVLLSSLSNPRRLVDTRLLAGETNSFPNAFSWRQSKTASEKGTIRGGWCPAHFAPKTPQNEPVPDGSGIGS